MIKILFVCHGNICRSPMAEFITKRLADEAGLSDSVCIESAAVSMEEIGNDIYPPAIRKLREKGIPYQSRSARRITDRDIREFDEIVAMDESNVRYLHRLFGREACAKVTLMMSWCGEDRDVSDPWYTGDFEQTYRDLDRACGAMLTTLSGRR